MPEPRARRQRSFRTIALLALAGATAAAPAHARAQEQAQEPPGGPAPQERQIQVGELLAAADRLPPPQRVGARAHTLRELQRVPNLVVLVESAEDATAAIGSWRGVVRFPVLIDDGSVRATEDIARFVRAFEPERVVRWKPQQPLGLPNEEGERARRLVELLSGTIQGDQSVGSMRELVDRIRQAGLGPQGVVAIDLDDPAWIGGFALAAGRIQPLLFIESVGRPNRSITGGEMRQIADTIQQQLALIGVEWAELGDEVDMLTVAANVALRVGLGTEGDDQKALTDLLGRHRGGIGTRWGWCGALFGGEARSLYRAMCGLFLATDSAWLFDGYGQGDPWDLYDATSAGRVLEDAGFAVTVLDTPNNRLNNWRLASARGLDAGLIFINSKGMTGFFDVAGDKAWSGDIPLLNRPAAVHMVHSWAARTPERADTVAGRWLEHGAYAFYGSVDEPFLRAFVHTPQVAARLLGGYPFGTAPRHDTSPPWKLNVLGDPLITFIPGSTAGQRLPSDVPVPGTVELDEEKTEAIRAGRFGEAIRALALEARDEDAARLAAALMRDRPEAFGNDAARWSVLPLYRDGRYDAMIEAYRLLSPDDQQNLLLQDALWHTSRLVLTRDGNPTLEGLLRRNLRAGQEEHDALELAEHLAARAGAPEALRFLQEVAPTIEHERRRGVVLDAITRYGG